MCILSNLFYCLFCIHWYPLTIFCCAVCSYHIYYNSCTAPFIDFMLVVYILYMLLNKRLIYSLYVHTYMTGYDIV